MESTTTETQDPDSARRRFLALSSLLSAEMVFGTGLYEAACHAQPEAKPADLPSLLPKARAIVIGIDETTNTKPSPLTHCVADAKRFAEWLVESGNVPAKFIEFLSNPGEGNEVIPGVRAKRATRDNILDTMLNTRPGPGERLYFYFSGHGTRFEERERAAPVLEGILPCDFAPGKTKPISVEWIKAFFEMGMFDEQFFLFDMCRTLGTSSVEGGYSRPLDERSADSLQPDVVIFYSTQATCESKDTGLFMKAFLEAVSHHKGSAKRYDRERKNYRVDVMSIKDFLPRYCLRDGIRVMIRKGGKDVPQKPDINLMIRSEKILVLAEIEAKKVDDVSLTVVLNPPAALNKVKIALTADDSEVGRQVFAPPIAHPMTILRKPLGYTVEFQSAEYYYRGYYSGRRWELYDDTVLQIDLEVGQPVVTVKADTSLSIFGMGKDVLLQLRDINGLAFKTANGNLQHVARGDLHVMGLKAADYRLMVNKPNEEPYEEIVRVDKGVVNPLFPADPPFQALMLIGPREPSECANDIEILWTSKVLKEAGDARWRSSPPTALMQLARIADQGLQVDIPLSVFSGIGLKPLSQVDGGARVSAGIRLILASDGTEEAARATMDRFEFGMQSTKGGDVRPLLVRSGTIEDPKFAELGTSLARRVRSLIQPMEPGCYRLRSTRKQDNEGSAEVTETILNILPGHLCQVIVYVDYKGLVHVTQLMPHVNPPQHLSAAVIALVDRIQAEYWPGRRDLAPMLVAEFLKDRGPELLRSIEPDPFAAALALNLLSLEGKPVELMELARSIVRRHPALPDGHVALAWALESNALNDRGSAENAYRVAFEHGLPTLQRFLRLLVSGMRRYKIAARDALRPRFELMTQIESQIISTYVETAWRVSGT